MRIIVLGASGQIGSVIFNGLRYDHDVIGTSRYNTERCFRFDPFQDDWSSLGKADVVINCIGRSTRPKHLVSITSMSALQNELLTIANLSAIRELYRCLHWARRPTTRWNSFEPKELQMNCCFNMKTPSWYGPP